MSERSRPPSRPLPRDHFDRWRENFGTKAQENQVGLLPRRGWQQRNLHFLGNVLLPKMFSQREGISHTPLLVRPSPGQVVVTWIGHATFLLQTAEKNILIDPNWALWHGPVKRLRQPGVPLRDLPRIDMILISHAHYDHLHLPTLRALASGQTVLVPKGVGSLLQPLAFGKVLELDHWEAFEQDDLKVTMMPARHWGARCIHDTWRKFGGFLIENQGQTWYHAGDSALFDGFREMGQRARIDVAILPIGAYDSPSGRPVHMNPEEALDAFAMLGAARCIPMHYATFPLGTEPVWEPEARLTLEASLRKIRHQVDVLKEGNPMLYSFGA